MGKYADDLRTRGTEALRLAGELMSHLSDDNASLLSALAEAQAADTIDGMRTRLEAISSSLTISNKARQQAQTVALMVIGNMSIMLADQADYLMQSGAMKTATDRLRRNRERNEKMRLAAARGDWSEHDRLIAELLSEYSGGGLATEPSGADTGTGTGG